MTKKKSDSFIVTLDEDNNEYNVVDQLELNKYAMKATVDPATHSKQVPADTMMVGKSLLNPKYNPYDFYNNVFIEPNDFLTSDNWDLKCCLHCNIFS